MNSLWTMCTNHFLDNRFHETFEKLANVEWRTKGPPFAILTQWATFFRHF